MNEKQVKELAEIIINFHRYDIEKCMKEYPKRYEQFVKEERELMKREFNLDIKPVFN